MKKIRSKMKAMCLSGHMKVWTRQIHVCRLDGKIPTIMSLCEPSAQGSKNITFFFNLKTVILKLTK